MYLYIELYQSTTVHPWYDGHSLVVTIELNNKKSHFLYF